MLESFYSHLLEGGGIQGEDQKILHFGEPLEELRAFQEEKKALIWVDADLGVLRISGKDRVAYINRLVTIELKSIENFQLRKGFFVNGKGRFEYQVFFCAKEDALLLVMPKAQISSLMAKLEMYHFGEEVSWEKLDYFGFAIHGDCASTLLENTFSTVPEEGHFGETSENNFILANPLFEKPGFLLLVSAPNYALTFEKLKEAGAVPSGEVVRNHLKIKFLEPTVDRELTEETIPLEVPHFVSWISFNKGCFPGQEVLARMHNLGHPNKVLTRFQLPKGKITENTPVFTEDKEVGFLTTISTLENETIGLGYLGWRAREKKQPVFIKIENEKCPVTPCI